VLSRSHTEKYNFYSSSPKQALWSVQYEDGDSEQLNAAELEQAVRDFVHVRASADKGVIPMNAPCPEAASLVESVNLSYGSVNMGNNVDMNIISNAHRVDVMPVASSSASQVIAVSGSHGISMPVIHQLDSIIDPSAQQRSSDNAVIVNSESNVTKLYPMSDHRSLNEPSVCDETSEGFNGSSNCADGVENNGVADVVDEPIDKVAVTTQDASMIDSSNVDYVVINNADGGSEEKREEDLDVNENIADMDDEGSDKDLDVVVKDPIDNKAVQCPHVEIPSVDRHHVSNESTDGVVSFLVLENTVPMSPTRASPSTIQNTLVSPIPDAHQLQQLPVSSLLHMLLIGGSTVLPPQLVASLAGASPSLLNAALLHWRAAAMASAAVNALAQSVPLSGPHGLVDQSYALAQARALAHATALTAVNSVQVAATAAAQAQTLRHERLPVQDRRVVSTDTADSQAIIDAYTRMGDSDIQSQVTSDDVEALKSSILQTISVSSDSSSSSSNPPSLDLSCHSMMGLLSASTVNNSLADDTEDKISKTQTPTEMLEMLTRKVRASDKITASTVRDVTYMLFTMFWSLTHCYSSLIDSTFFFLVSSFLFFFASEKLVIIIGVSARSSASWKSAFPSIWLGASSESPWHSDWSSKQTWEDSCVEGI
jgi:hypothetical protein